MTTLANFGAEDGGAEPRFGPRGVDSGTLEEERLSLAATRGLREHGMHRRAVPPGPVCGALLVLFASLAAGGCNRPLAVQDEYFSAARGSPARAREETLHFVSHHRALQVAQHSCAATPVAAGAPPRTTGVAAAPELGSAAAHDALHRLCASLPLPPPVHAQGAVSNAYRRWVEDNVRELPDASETAAGGS